MPKNFERCVKEGGKVFTKSLSKDRYVRICVDKDGKTYAGEVKVKKNAR